MPTAARTDPYSAFNFLVDIDGITLAGFSECSGLTAESDHIEYRTGDMDITVSKLPGLRKYANIVLKHGLTSSTELWQWRLTVITGQTVRRSGSITLLDEGRKKALEWTFSAGLAVQVRRADPQRQEQRGRDRNARDLPRAPGAGMTMPAGTVARAPGVSVEWVSADVPVPAAVRTDVAGFIGLAQRGPVHQPVRLASWSQFQAVFGGYDPRGWLAYAVNGFFANGGDACWVVRVVDPATAQAASADLAAATRRRRP